jgi:transposase
MTPSMQQQQQRMVIENAKRELRALTQQRNIAEQGIEALGIAGAELSTIESGISQTEKALLMAVTALCSIRLLELQINVENSAERIPKLEAFLKQAESGISIPGLVI